MKRSFLMIVACSIVALFYAGSLSAAIYNPATGHYYELVSGVGDWSQAENSAIALGGHLVTINNQAEQDWLMSNFGEARYWIGFTDMQIEGTWVWTSGEPITYTNWEPGEPNDYWQPGGEDYAAMNWATDTGSWNDFGPDSHDIGTVQGGIAEIASVPIPAAVWFLGSGLIGIVGIRRKIKK